MCRCICACKAFCICTVSAHISELCASAAGVLWLSMIAEFMYISLLGMGFLLLWVEVLCAHKEMHALKINAFAAICTVLSGKIVVLGSLLWSILVLHYC